MTQSDTKDGVSVLASAIVDGDLEAAVSAAEQRYREVDRPAVTDAEFASLLSLAVAERDKGRVQVALNAMTRLWSLRHDRNLCVEILVIQVIWLSSGLEFQRFLPTIPSNIIKDKHVKLLVARGFEISRDLISAVEAIIEVTDNDVSMVPSFLDLRRNVLSSLSGTLSRTLQRLVSSTGDQQIAAALANVSGQMYVSALHRGLSPNEFERQLRSMAFTGDVNSRVPMETIAEAMVSMTDGVQSEKLTVALRFLVSLRDERRADLVACNLLNSPFRLHPDFIKSLYKLAELPGMAKWRQPADELCAEFVYTNTVDSSWSLSRLAIQLREVSGRSFGLAPNASISIERQSLPRTKPLRSTKGKRIFVGLFGQLRFPTETIPSLCNYVDEQTRALKESGWELSYGVSTWDKVGVRAIHMSDPALFAIEKLPEFLGNLLFKVGVSQVKDIMDILPNTIQYIINRNVSDQTIDNAYLRKICNRDVVSDIYDDAQFMESEGNIIASSCGNDFNIINQARMWNRISAFKGLVERVNKSNSDTVSHVLLVRADLCFRHGSLGDVISAALEGPSNSIAADDSPHANFIEGLGDRFIFSDLDAFGRLSDGSSLMQSAANSKSLSADYLQRFSAHQFLDTILFEHGTQVTRVPHAKLGFEIYRGRVTVEDIRPFLSADLAMMSAVELKAKIESNLGD